MAQKKQKPKKGLVVRRSAPGAGLGLVTTEPIRKKEFVIAYTGELISDKEADLRGGKYLFDINSRWTIDGKGRDNLARYINHSCKPNCESKVIGKGVKIYARKNIKAGEELNYDYGEEYFDEFIKPHGCRCTGCLEKKKKKK
jgi:hypothetical protein